MDANGLLALISSVGFPIVACGGLAWFFKYITDKEREERTALNEQHRQELTQINDQHRQEMNEVTQALNNNTLALQRLCDRLDQVD